jgi:hypothetical protein
MKLYHGTHITSATSIMAQGVDVSKGGGELGQGFYLGDLEYRSYLWAYQQHGAQAAIVEMEMEENDIIDERRFSLHLIQSKEEAYKIKKEIKNVGGTRTYLFGVDIVWSPVIGGGMAAETDVAPLFNQFKFESEKAGDYLNSTSVKTTISR